MRSLFLSAVTATAFLCPFPIQTVSAQQIGQPLPDIEAVKWYNTPPLALEQLRGRAVLVEVFRTW